MPNIFSAEKISLLKKLSVDNDFFRLKISPSKYLKMRYLKMRYLKMRESTEQIDIVIVHVGLTDVQFR